MSRLIWALALGALLMSPTAGAEDDPYLWLEEVEGEEALAWVEERSAQDTAEIKAHPSFEPIHQQLLEIYNSEDRIPTVTMRGEHLYNFWRDAEHVRGIWRRTTLDSYLTDTPDWETLIDVDALAEAEDENWVWKGAQGLPPDYDRYLVNLSRGGGDATVVREFDAGSQDWVEDGFFVPEAKSSVSWKDRDTVWIGTDFGEGSLTDSGYARISKEWARGTSLEEARTVFEGEKEDVAAGTYTVHSRDYPDVHVIYQIPQFYRGTYRVLRDGEPVALDLPVDVQIRNFFQGQLMFSLRSPWEVGGRTYAQDALLAVDLDAFLEGSREFEILFEPTERVSLGGVGNTKDKILLVTLDNVRSRLYEMHRKDGEWVREEVTLPGIGSVGLSAISDEHNTYLLTYTDPLTPSSLYLKRPGQTPEQIKTTPAWFDPEGMVVEQFEAESADGTMVPYFVMLPPGFTADGTHPTLLYGYGGFEVSQLPTYSGTVGASWVARGGVYVLANIRGGGEFGPRWHQAALRENRQRSFDDFIAIAEDLVARKITSPEHLGIVGGSNGGLLVGACMVQRPELFGAVVCQVPLLDMKRYHKLLAGASWMAEYGNPDTADWEYMKEWSPYHNVDAEAEYPKAFFYTSTRDDRVHPGHARKMVRKLIDLGKPVYYYENTEGGHGMASNENQRAMMWAMTYAYLFGALQD